ncbi:MAG: VWA domain-containing protein [Thermoleophilaceae bacterium]|nr:VWA domain-containing protein [Thermoleophilaceae bacterium]
MSFQAPLFLLALALVPAAVVAYVLARRRRRRFAVRFTGTSTLAGLVDAVPAWKRHLPAALFAAALAALAIALARPEATVAVPLEQASVLLVTDVSGSMQARDVEPTRLDAARAAALDFLGDVPDEVRVGAVAYSTVPHTIDRPGTDRSAVVELMENLTADGGTATGDALAQALELLGKRQKGDRPPAAIVLLSDGETTTGRDPVEVARQARRAKVPVYTVALGTSEGVIETPGGLLPVPPDPETMREIARVSGGRAFTAEDENRLDQVYKQLGSRIGSRREQREITAGFAAGGLVLLLGAAGLALHGTGRLP